MIKKSSQLLNGTEVNIRAKDSWFNGGWGIVSGFNGEVYNVTMYKGKESAVFKRSELRVVKQT